MAVFNLLKASYKGKLGETYGQKQYGKAFCKAIPFSHAPFSQSQKGNYSAFIRLQRFACGQWRGLKSLIRIENSRLLPQNVLCEEFKKMKQGAFFTLDNIYEVCDKLVGISIQEASYSVGAKEFTLKYTLSDNRIAGIPEETLLTCYEQETICLYSSQADYGENTVSFATNQEEITQAHFIFTQYRKRKKGWKVMGALAVPVNIIA